MDRITANQERLTYANVCIKVEASMEIFHFIEVELNDGSFVSIFIEVPWFP